jgi:DNA polymerase-3 subunit epsilon
VTQDRVVILDFETTGLSTNGGDRVIEVGAVTVESGRITDSFQTLVNPGVQVSHFIESYTGIGNSMLSKAPGADDVFPDLYRFIDGAVIIAHNASFDRKFLDMELANVGYSNVQPFLCSMRIARRLYPKAPNHKLGTLVKYARVPVTGEFHRALADAEMTAGLWITMMELLTQEYGLLHLELQLLQKLQSLPIARTRHWLSNYASAHHLPGNC